MTELLIAPTVTYFQLRHIPVYSLALVDWNQNSADKCESEPVAFAFSYQKAREYTLRMSGKEPPYLLDC